MSDQTRIKIKKRGVNRVQQFRLLSQDATTSELREMLEILHDRLYFAQLASKHDSKLLMALAKTDTDSKIQKQNQAEKAAFLAAHAAMLASLEAEKLIEADRAERASALKAKQAAERKAKYAKTGCKTTISRAVVLQIQAEKAAILADKIRKAVQS